MRNVGRTIPHDSAAGHVTGNADYIGDMPKLDRELVVGVVGSPVAAGRIRGIDVAAARAMPGVAVVMTHEDIPGHKKFGPIFHDEPILPAEVVSYVGQPIVILGAEDRASLEAARALVRIEVTESAPILSIEQAIEQQRFLAPENRIHRGDVQTAVRDTPHQLSGVFHCGGQEQFYLESQAALAVPTERDQLTVYSSTQNTTEIQHVVAEALGIGNHHVVCVCRRMGGAFGGKETQAALPAAFAALVACRLNVQRVWCTPKTRT